MVSQPKKGYMPDIELQLPEALPGLTLEGVLEGVRDNRLHGWVWDTANPAQAIVVEVLGPAGYYSVTVADEFRADLQSASKRNGCCAINLLLPEELISHETGGWALIVEGTTHALRPVGGPDHSVIENWVAHQGNLLWQLLTQRVYWAMTGQRASKAEFDIIVAKMEHDAASALSVLVQRLARQQQVSSAQDTLNWTVNDVVRAVYKGVLKREPEARGYEIYGYALRHGLAHHDFIGELLRLPEFHEIASLAFVSTHNSSSASAMVELTRLSSSIERSILTLAMEAASATLANGDVLPALPSRSPVAVAKTTNLKTESDKHSISGQSHTKKRYNARPLLGAA